MGDTRFSAVYERVANAEDRAAAIRALSDEDAVAALAAASTHRADPLLANILATEVQNRLHRARTITSHIGEGVLAVNRAGRVTFMNAAAERLLGWTADELVGQHAHDTLHYQRPDGEPLARKDCTFLDALSAREPARSDEDAFTRKDGTLMPVACTAAPMLLEGEATGAVFVFRDVTARKEAERLRATLHAVTRILANADTIDGALPDILETVGERLRWDAGGIWWMDRGGNALHCVDFWPRGEGFDELEDACRGQRFAPGEGIPGSIWETGKPFWTLDTSTLDAERYPRARAAHRAGLRGVFAFPCPVAMRPIAVIEYFSREPAVPDETLLQTVQSLGSEIGQFIHRMRADARLRESEARKRGVLESALDAIVTTDDESTILEWNAAAERLFGYAREEALGRDVADLIIPERYRAAHHAGMARYNATGEGPVLGKRIELPALRKDGTEFLTELYIVPVKLVDHTVFTSHLREITGRDDALPDT